MPSPSAAAALAARVLVTDGPDNGTAIVPERDDRGTFEEGLAVVVRIYQSHE